MASSPSRTLKLTYLGDASNLSKSTKKAGDDVKTLGDRVKGVGKALAVGFAAIGAAGVAMGKKLFDAFEQVSTANARIEAVVTSMGNFEGEIAGVTDRLVKQAEATARLTGVDRNLIKESQALLLTFDSVNKTAGDAGGVFDRATQAAVDLAAAGFGSVTGNAQQLGKALEDPIKGLTALTRSGVTFTAEQQALIRSLVESNQLLAAQDIVLQAIERQVGGVAEATANGSARIKQSFGILTEQIAMALAPAFEKLVGFALKFVDDAMGWWQVNGDDVIQKFKDFATEVQTLVSRFRELSGLLVEELRAGGTFARLNIRLFDLRRQAGRTREAFGELFDALAGGDTESKMSTFAGLLDTFYFKPINVIIDRAEKLLKVLEMVAKFSSRLKGLTDEISSGERGSLGNLGLGAQGFGLPASPAASSGTVINLNVSGASDPEGAARTIQRTLSSSNLRLGLAPTPGLATVA
jgi:hypothetical protein